MEFNHYSLGLSRLSANIIDRSNSRRFEIHLHNFQLKTIKDQLTGILLALFMEFVLLNLNDPISSPYYYFETPVAYFFVILTVPYALWTFRDYQKNALKSIRVSVLICLATSLFLSAFNRFPLEYGSLILIRLLSGPVIIGYRASALFITLVYFIFFFRLVLRCLFSQHLGDLHFG